MFCYPISRLRMTLASFRNIQVPFSQTKTKQRKKLLSVNKLIFLFINQNFLAKKNTNLIHDSFLGQNFSTRKNKYFKKLTLNSKIFIKLPERVIFTIFRYLEEKYKMSIDNKNNIWIEQNRNKKEKDMVKLLTRTRIRINQCQSVS